MAYQDDSAYYRNRAAEEYERARQAANAAIAAIHDDLARRYGARAVQVIAENPDSPLEGERPGA